jgi:hypothetical protein
MSYKFGVSYNCHINDQINVDDDYCVGGADEVGTSLDYVGDSFDKICKVIEAEDFGYNMVLVTEGFFIGYNCSLGGKVIAYYGEDNGDGDVSPEIVIFEDPSEDLMVTVI